MLLTLGRSMLSLTVAFLAGFALALGAALAVALGAALAVALGAALAVALGAALAVAFTEGLAALADALAVGFAFSVGLAAVFFVPFVAAFAILVLPLTCSVWILRRPAFGQCFARPLDQRLDGVGKVHLGDIVVAALDADLVRRHQHVGMAEAGRRL